jgi:hypothetical protein
MNARHYLTLHSNHLPETGKRQHENKAGAQVSTHGIDCGIIRPEKICAVMLPPNEMHSVFRCGATSGERFMLFEWARKRTDCRIELPVVARLLTGAQRNPDLYRFERGCIAAPAAAICFLKCERLFNPQPVRYRKTISAFQQRLCFPGLHIPALPGAA